MIDVKAYQRVVELLAVYSEAHYELSKIIFDQVPIQFFNILTNIFVENLVVLLVFDWFSEL